MVAGHNPGDQVRSISSKCRQANARFACESPVHVGHEGRTLFVTRRDEAELAVQESIHHVDVLLTGYAKDVLHPFVLEAANKEFSTFHVNVTFLVWRVLIRVRGGSTKMHRMYKGPR